MPSTYMTEGFLEDVISFIKMAGTVNKNVRKGITDRKVATAYNTSSIAKLAKSLTMSFPVVCSDTISPSTAAMITKAIERNNLSMVRMAVAAYHIQANSGLEAIKMVHTNLDNDYSADDIIDAVVGGTKGLMQSYIDLKETADFCKRPPINYSKFLEEARIEFLNTCNIKYPDSSFSENAISDYVVSNRFNDFTVLKEAKNKRYDPAQINKDIKDFEKEKDKTAKRIGDSYKGVDNENLKNFMDWNSKNRDFEYKKQRDVYNDKKDELQLRRDLFTRQLLDSDVKKANDLQPSLLVIPFYYTDESGQHPHEFIAGVKARLITTTSEEIIEHISRFNQQSISQYNLYKATTGETSLAKEFIAAIQSAKIDALRDSTKMAKTSPLWRTLMARSARSGVKRLARVANSKNAAAAITTLVITQQEADYIFENNHVDITNPVIAREFMENYNFMCLVIVDEQTEIAKFFYDGEQYFSDYSFSTLEKDNSGNDTRKLISLLNKTR